MDEIESLSPTERLLLMAAAVHGLGPENGLSHANAARVVDQVLRWNGLSAEAVRQGWWSEPPAAPNAEVHGMLVRMTHETHTSGPGRAPQRPGPALFEGAGNWGTPGDASRPPALPQYTSCRLTERGQQIARELLRRHSEYRIGDDQLAQVVYHGPDGQRVEGPSEDFLRSIVVREPPESWKVGSGHSGLERANCKEVLMFFAVESHRMYVSFVPPADAEIVTTLDGSTSEVVEHCVGGEPFVRPRACFLPRSLAWEVVREFCRSGQRLNSLQWAPLGELTYDDPDWSA